VTRYLVSFFVFILYIDYTIYAASIFGYIREDATGEPLAYANVFIQQSGSGDATNKDGYYVILNLPSGHYNISVSIIGYAMITQPITINSDENQRVDFRLKLQAIETGEVRVSAERQKFEKEVSPSRVIMDFREIKIMPAFVEADVFRAIQHLPGVQTLNDFSSALYVRGSTPEQNLIMLDGITVYNPFHIGGVFSTFNTDAIKEADFHAGGFSARYGGRMGSILNIINREGNTEEFKGKANISLISSKALIEGPMHLNDELSGSWMLAGRRTYFDQVADAAMYIIKKSRENEPGYDADNYPDHIFPYYFYDIQTKANLDISHDHRLTFSGFYGDDVLYFANEDQNTYNSNDSSYSRNIFDWKWGNKTTSLSWRWIINPGLIMKTFLADSRYRFHIDMDFWRNRIYSYDNVLETNYSENGFDVFDIIEDNTLEAEFTWLASDIHKITSGIQYKRVNFDLGMEFRWRELDSLYDNSVGNEIVLNDVDTSYMPLDIQDHTIEQSIFVEDKWEVNQLLTLVPGLRMTYYNLHRKIYYDLRFGGKLKITKNLALKLNMGRYHQFLTIVNPQDVNFHFVDIWMGLRQDLSASYANHYIFSLEYLALDNTLFRAEAYYKNMYHMLTLKQGDFFRDSDEFMVDTFNEFYDTKGIAKGIELLIKKTRGKARGWLGYTYADILKQTAIDPWFYPQYDRKHTIDFVCNWQWTEMIHVSTAISYSSGNPFTPILGHIQQWDEDYYNQKNELLTGEKNSQRYPAYFRWDISFIHRKPFLNGYREFYLQIINITNHLNVLGYIYDNKYDNQTGEYIGVQRAEIPMFPIMPTFGIRFEF